METRGKRQSSGARPKDICGQAADETGKGHSARPPGAQTANNAMYMQKIRDSQAAVNSGDFRQAVQLYTEAIEMDPTNHILYTNRSAAYSKLQMHDKSLKDARKAKEINPKWPKAYLREGVALQNLGQHGESLGALAEGLAQEQNNAQLLSGLMEAAMKSPLKEKLGPVFNQLQKLKLSQSPFVIISVIGQELLAIGQFKASVRMLEASLAIGTCSLKLRGSVFSALSSAYWGMGDLDSAITNMQHDLSVAKSLGDLEGECRAHGNLGSAYFSKGQYKDALSNHRYQLALAMKLKKRDAAASALGSLGHVYTAIGDYPNALNSHKQCLFLMKQSGDKLAEAREIGNAGAVYLAMGEFQHAIDCHQKHLQMAKNLKNMVEEARAYSNLGSAYHYKRDYEKAMLYHKQVLQIGESKKDKVLEARAYAGLGHAARCMQDYDKAKEFHEKQLDNALQTKDKVAEGRACSNLGIIYHQLKEYKNALKLHEVHLKIAKNLGDRASQGRAYGNLGNAHCSMGQYDQAIKFHKLELSIASDVNDRHSEGTTHGNLAVALQSTGKPDKALQHYQLHLQISKELKDTVSEARALCNLGNFFSSKGDHSSAVSYYEEYLNLSQELLDSEGEAKACFNLGYAHFALGNHIEAVRYYEQDLSIAKELKDQLGMARAYCNLGLAHTALKNFEDALECQKMCLSMMKSMKNTKGIFRALGNIGDITLKTGDTAEAIKIYNQQLQLAKQCNKKDLIASSYGALGAAHRILGQYDKALGYHTQELSIRQDMDDLRGECRAHGNLGSVHMALGNYQNAFKCYTEQLEKSQELQDSALEAQASGNLGITRMNMGMYDDAIGMFEHQLAMLEQVSGLTSTLDKGHAFGNLGDCYESLGDFEESIKCHNQFLAISQQTNNLSDQDKAYRGLGNAHRSVGNLQQALWCFEKRLVVAHELNSSASKASAYGELGCLHSLLGNFEQAISCLQHQLSIAQEIQDQICEGEAACGLGGVYQQMGEYDKALEYHKMDLEIAEATGNKACQCRAYGNLGLSHESLFNYKEAKAYQEQHLSIAAEINDRVAKTLAYSSLGRVHHAMNNHAEAVDYLRQGLQIAEQLGRNEEEAKIRHRLGLSLWGKGDLEECYQQLYKAADLFEGIRRDAQFNSEYKMSLFDLQTACYQALQRVLVTLKRHDEALVIAERACTRAFIDYLLERQAGAKGLYKGHMDPPPITSDQIVNLVSKQKSLVLCYSVAAGYLYCWLLAPNKGIVKFHEANMVDLEALDTDSFHDNLSMKSISFTSSSMLDQYVGQVRESMGIERHSSRLSLPGKSGDCESDSEEDEEWQQHLEELGDKLNAENDKTGFLRMVNRNHKMNSSSYSLSSMYSLSANGLGSSFHSIHRTRSINNRAKESGKAPVSALYQLLIEPLEEAIASCVQEMGATGPVDLVLVVQGELYLIPFSVLRKDQNSSFLFERFNLCIMPSITALQNAHKHDKQGRPVIDSSGAIVVGNPKLSANVLSNWHLKEIPSSEYEARIVGEILTCRPLIGAEATKAAVIQQIEQVEVLHFATHLSWKLSSIILASSDNIPPHHHRFPTIDISDDSASDISSFDGPILSEYLLTAADILNLKLHAKLVVLSSGYTDDRAGRINSDGVVGLTRALLSAGAQCVLFSLWPVPDQAAKLLMRTFYSSLQEGMCATQALSTAMRGVQSNKQFSHASNWGGWVLVGHDIKLSSKVALMGHAICEILQCQTQCREAMRVLLHLIEKSLQRIHQGIKNSMYTTSQSIENKVFGVPGWKDLLQAVGFRFESATNGLPPAAYFPQTDPGDRLTRASASLQALLGLPPSALAALSKFLHNYEAGEANIRVMRDILSKMAAKESNIEIQIIVSLWRDIPGCHEFLASLGLDLVDVGQDEVTLRLGKQANRRQLQFALQSLVAVFDTSEAPKSLSIDSSSSLESLSSSHSGSTSTSNFSKGSTPPLSPHGSRKRSLFNPAEMEKMRMQNKMHLMNQGGLSGRQLGRKHLRQQVDPALHLSLQSQVRTRYPLGSAGSRLTEVSENSESDIEGRKSGDGSWGERMHVSTNSESDSSIIADVFPDHHNPTFVDENGQESLDHLQTGSPVVMETEEYSLSRHDSQQSADRFSFTHDDNIRKSSMSRNSVSSEDSIYFQKSGTGLPQQASDQGNIEVSNANEEKENVKVISEDSQELFSEKITLESTQDNLDPEINSTESGIHSGMTSSNQSDISQQSTEGLTFDPTELSLKVMQEIGDTKQVIDDLQRESFINSKKETCLKRQSYQQQLSNPNIDRSGVIVPEKSLNSNLSVADQIKSKIPPPVPSKPKIAPKPSTFESTLQRLISTDDSDKDVEKTTNEDKDSQSTSANQNQHKPAISGDNNVTVVTSPDSNSVQIKTNTSSSIPLAPVSSSSAPLRSFRPQPKSRVLNSMQRPDSTTSTSSWCSSASSVQSVIHRPLIGSLKDVKETNLDAESCSSSQSSPHPECGNNRPLPPYDGTNAAYYLHRGSPIQQYYSSSSASSTPTWKHSNSSPDIGQFSASRTGPVWKPANSTPDISQHSANGKPMQSSNPAHHQPVSTNAPGAVNRLDSLLETCQVQSADYGQKLNSSYMNQSLNSSGNSVTSTSHNMPVNQKYLLDNSGSSLGSFQNLNSSSDSFQEMGNFPGPKKRTVSSGIVLRSRANCVSPANSTQSGGSPLPRSTSPSSSITSRGSPCQYLGHQNKAKSILNSSPMANSGGKKRPTKRVSFSDSEPSDLENHSPNLFSPNKAGMNGGLMKIKPGDYSLPMTTKVNGVPPSSSINPVTGLPLHHGYNKSMSNIKSVPGHYPLCNGTQVKLGHEANGYALHSLGPPNGDIVLGASRTAAYPFPPRQMNGHGQAYLNLNETDNKTMSQGGVPSGTVRSQVLYTSKC